MKKIVQVVASVIFDGNLILATQRGYGKFAGLWEFPGGKIEEGESDVQAVKREIREELTVEIEVGELLKTIEYDYPDFKLKMNCYKSKIVSGEIKLLEHLNCKWVGKDNIMDLEWLPADLEFVQELKELL